MSSGARRKSRSIQSAETSVLPTTRRRAATSARAARLFASRRRRRAETCSFMACSLIPSSCAISLLPRPFATSSRTAVCRSVSRRPRVRRRSAPSGNWVIYVRSVVTIRLSIFIISYSTDTLLKLASGGVWDKRSRSRSASVERGLPVRCRVTPCQNRARAAPAEHRRDRLFRVGGDELQLEPGKGDEDDRGEDRQLPGEGDAEGRS